MIRSFKHLGKDFNKKSKKTRKSIKDEIPLSVGRLLVRGFRRSFDMQKFNDYSAPKWEDVKRRQKGSPWYGFQYGSNGKVTQGSRGFTKNGKPRKFGTRGGKTNFSKAATTRAILRGSGSINLQESIFLAKTGNHTVVVANNQPHAEIHNEGGKFKIFGGKAAEMPQRKFMGHSILLTRQIKPLIGKTLTKHI